MTTRSLTKKDFRLKKLTTVEIIVIVVHILISSAFCIAYEFNLMNALDLRVWISGYYFSVPFILVGILFRNLRNFRFFLSWILISMIQIAVYFSVAESPGFLYYRGTAFSGLRALLPTLILFQLFRMYLLRTQGREFITTMRTPQFSTSMWEEEDKRNISWLEVLFTTLLALTIIVFHVI